MKGMVERQIEKKQHVEERVKKQQASTERK